MIRQQRRRLERQWSKIKIGEICTNFIEHNNLFSLAHIIAYRAVKVSEDLVCVDNIALFDYHKDKGHGEYLTLYLLVDGSLKRLDSIRVGFVQEFDLWEVDEID